MTSLTGLDQEQLEAIKRETKARSRIKRKKAVMTDSDEDPGKGSSKPNVKTLRDDRNYLVGL